MHLGIELTHLLGKGDKISEVKNCLEKYWRERERYIRKEAKRSWGITQANAEINVQK